MHNREVISTTSAPKAIGPYSQGIRAGGLVFVSGQIPIDPATEEIIEGDIRTQTRRVLKNLQDVLEAANLSLKDVVKTTLFLTNMEDYGAINEVYAEFFEDSRPARSTVEVSRLPKGAGVEIEAIAVVES